MTVTSILAASLLLQGVLALVRPRAVIAFNAWIARLLKHRSPPEREARVRALGAIETILGGLMLAVALS